MSERTQQREALRLDEFVSGILGYPVYELKAAEGWSLLNERSLKETLMAYTKVPIDEKEKVSWLLRQGWEFIDTDVQLSKVASKLYQSKPEGITFRLARQQDEDEVARIARESFSCSRWHCDDRIDNGEANRIKEEWARNFWRGKRGDYMVVAERKGEVIGFNQLLRWADGTLVIDLIAVDESSRQRGVGSGMIAFVEEALAPVSRMIVGTQLTNTASLRMYQNCGFRINGASHIFHCHLPRHGVC